MKLNEIIKVVPSFGKGVALGLGISATFFGLLALILSYNNSGTVNFGSFLAIGSGVFCIYIGLTMKKNDD